MRTDYGFSRTVCACAECKRNCAHVSGMIAPADLERWRVEHASDADYDRWCRLHLAASPGATVMQHGQVFRIPTLVPRREATGRCHWLSLDERCLVHATAPYGCAVFDCRMSKHEGDKRSATALIAIMADWNADGPYSTLWRTLQAAGQTVQGPEHAHAQMRQQAR